MKYANITNVEVVNGKDVGVSVYTQGCPHHCYKCFNPETWDFDSGFIWSEKEENKVLSLLKNSYVKRLTILGGEPLIKQNKNDLHNLLKKVKEIHPNKQIWLYTGYIYEDIKSEFYDIIKYVDVLVDGKYVDKLRDVTLKFRGSSNQRIIDVQKSLEKKEVILFE